MASLANKAVLGAIWSISTSIGGRVLGLLGTLILTRFLAPEEYGVVSVAIVLVATIDILSSPGFGQYVVANPKAGRDVVFHATVVHVLTGWILLAVLVALQHVVAGMFAMPDMVSYLPIMAVAAGIGRLSYIPKRVLARDMRFDVLGMTSLASEVTYAGTAVFLAWRGWGPAAVMWAYVARLMVTTAICVSSVELADWLQPSRLSMTVLREMLDFGLPMTGANVMHFAAHRGDNLLVAGMFGPAAVGHYNFAYNIANIPATHIGEHIGDVLLPSFSKLETVEDMHRALVRASGLLALVVFPLAVGLGAVGYTLVAVLLDPRWAMVAPMLVILSGLSVFRPVGWILGSYLQAVKRTRVLMGLEVVKVAVLFSMLVGLGQLGVLWACGAIGAAFGLHALLSLWIIQRLDAVPMGRLLRPYLGPILACVPMVGAVLGVRILLGVATWWSLIVEILVGAVVYVPSAFLLAGPIARDFLQLIQKVVRRRRSPADDPAPTSSARGAGE